MVGAIETKKTRILDKAHDFLPYGPIDAVLRFDHDGNLHGLDSSIYARLGMQQKRHGNEIAAVSE
jgi:hypothetical protein